VTDRPRILALFGTRVIFGAERENIEVLSALREQGCKVLCLVRDESWNDHIAAALAERGLEYRKVPFIDGWLRGWRIRTLLRNPVAFVVGNWRAVRIALEFRPTHFHAFNPFFVLNFIPLLVVFSRVPMIYRAGDQPLRHRLIWRTLWYFILARTQRFVAVSHFIANELERTGVRISRVEVIYPRPPKRVGLDGDAPVDGQGRNIAFIGQIIESKGPHILLQAFRRVAASYPEVRVVIAGRISEWKGDDWARNLVKSVSEDEVLRSRVSFPGFVQDIPRFLQSCEVLVAPSLIGEALGLVVLEAKEAGIPAIVFPMGGLPEMIEHGVDGYICRNCGVDGLEDALRWHLSSENTGERGVAARQSLARFGVSDFARRCLEAYERLA
jgi:glycosyltransferase involved in cell wall biosynthesis